MWVGLIFPCYFRTTKGINLLIPSSTPQIIHQPAAPSYQRSVVQQATGSDKRHGYKSEHSESIDLAMRGSWKGGIALCLMFASMLHLFLLHLHSVLLRAQGR